MMDFALRLWSKVNLQGENECWEWQSWKDRDGYGRLMVNGFGKGAHRLVWEMFRGEIPHGMNICHHCDNPSCVNPAHLFIGTQADNLADMVSKGKQVKGERVGTSRLTGEQVALIREEYSRGGISQAELGKKHGVARTTVGNIVRRERWKHL